MRWSSKRFRNRREAKTNFGEPCAVDAGAAAAVVIGAGGRRSQTRPAAIEPIGLVGLKGLARLQRGFQVMPPIGLQLGDLAIGDNAFGDELLGIDLQRRLVRADFLVHERLGERGLVAFVVAEPAIAEHVDDHRLVELLPELGRDLRGIDDGFGIIAVDVNDRRLDHFRGVRRIGRRPRMARRGGEADLIVDDEMDRPAGPVSLETGKAETFGDHALTRESRVAMDEERQDFRALDDIVQLILLGAHLAEDDGIDDLEMRRVRGQRKMDAVVVEVAVGRGAKMIFDVAGAFDVVGRKGAALEFVENRPVRLPHDLGQHIEAAAVRHAEDDVLDPQGAAALDDLFERRHHGFGAVKAKPLRARVFHVEEFLESLRFDELRQDGALAFLGEGNFLVRGLRSAAAASSSRPDRRYA